VPHKRIVSDTYLAGLVSMHMVALFIRMRRSTVLTQRRAFGLSATEWLIMTTMDERRPLSLNAIAERLVQDRGQLSRAVKAMVSRGLLTRVRKPGGPEVEIDLSPDGQVMRARILEMALERDQFLTQGIDLADLEAARRVIAQMTQRADVLLEQALAIEKAGR
jgi:DNA-binding MarR family transcriptional regulator